MKELPETTIQRFQHLPVEFTFTNSNSRGLFAIPLSQQFQRNLDYYSIDISKRHLKNSTKTKNFKGCGIYSYKRNSLLQFTFFCFSVLQSFPRSLSPHLKPLSCLPHTAKARISDTGDPAISPKFSHSGCPNITLRYYLVLPNRSNSISAY